MAYSLILQVETSVARCSVSLSRNEACIAFIEGSEERNHAAMLVPLIDRVLKGAHVGVSQLAAVAVGIGPGSYTGLRIGMSTAKGLCYGAGIPLIAVPTLRAMADGLLLQASLMAYDALICPMIDARRMEVYTALFDREKNVVKDTCAEVINEHSFDKWLEHHPVYFIGSGADKCKPLLTHPHAIFPPSYSYSARYMINDAWEAFQNVRFEDVAYSEPFYLKDFIAGKPVKNVFPSLSNTKLYS
ncbi:MAG: tRNA (adenosine(37)-N6)-threonylcarbamoyltransferase complex dimerization subunit type 1 TsaB [Bacteroidales bacterium]|nr:tRNA (adenosine(37)-N6)-threonylcarbamoyltransferase complex dimerization subunit type 1 TsaB [Bacteroidales bacterium]